MINVENRKVELKIQGQEVPTSYAELLKTVVDQPVREGVTISEMRANIQIIEVIEDAIRKNTKTLAFDKEHFKKVAKQVEGSTWAVNSVEILDFADYIGSLKETE